MARNDTRAACGEPRDDPPGGRHDPARRKSGRDQRTIAGGGTGSGGASPGSKPAGLDIQRRRQLVATEATVAAQHQRAWHPGARAVSSMCSSIRSACLRVRSPSLTALSRRVFVFALTAERTLVKRLALGLGDVGDRLAVAQLLEELVGAQAERVGEVADHPRLRAGAGPVRRGSACRRTGAAPPRSFSGPRAAEHAAGLLAQLLEPVGLLLRELAVLDRLVELRVLRRRQRVAQLVGRDAEALGRVVEDLLLGLAALVLRHRRDRRAGAACHERAAQRDRCDPSSTHVRVLLRSSVQRTIPRRT